MAQSPHAAAAVFLGNEGRIDARFLGNPIQAVPGFFGQGAQQTGEGLGDASGRAFISTLLGRIGQELRLQRVAFIFHDLPDRVFEGVKFRGESCLHQ